MKPAAYSHLNLCVRDIAERALNKCILGIKNLKKAGNRARLVLFITSYHKSADEKIFVPKKEIADRDFQGVFFYVRSVTRASFVSKNVKKVKIGMQMIF